MRNQESRRGEKRNLILQKCRTYDVTLTGKNAFIFSFSLSWLLKSNHAGTLCNSFWARSANVNTKNLTFRYSYYECKSSRENVWACTKCLLYPPDIPTPHIPTRKKPAHMFLNPPVMNLCLTSPFFYEWQLHWGIRGKTFIHTHIKCWQIAASYEKKGGRKILANNSFLLN